MSQYSFLAKKSCPLSLKYTAYISMSFFDSFLLKEPVWFPWLQQLSRQNPFHIYTLQVYAVGGQVNKFVREPSLCNLFLWTLAAMLPLPGHKFSTAKEGSGSFESSGSQGFQLNWYSPKAQSRFVHSCGWICGPLGAIKNVSAVCKFCVCREVTDCDSETQALSVLVD